MDTCDICPNIFYLYILLYIDLQAARYMFTYIYINIQLYTYPKKEDGKYLRIIWAVCVFHRAVSAFDPHRFGNYFGSYLPFTMLYATPKCILTAAVNAFHCVSGLLGVMLCIS